MKENISPEEKLLRLIKGKKSPFFSKKNNKNIAKSSNLTQALRGAIDYLSGTFLNPAHFSRIIPILLIISLIYLSITFIYPLVALRNIQVPKVNIQNSSSVEPQIKEESKPYESYLQGLNKRQIFSSSVNASSSNLPAAAGADVIKDLNLVGIISGENPQAIIEDKKSQKTYYLIKGQAIGELQIEDIQEGKIILNYRGQRYELDI